MPLYQTTNLTGPGIMIILPTGQDLVVAAGVLVGSEDDYGVIGGSSNHYVQVYGIVSGATGVNLGPEATEVGNNTVRVTREGSVFGNTTAINFFGSGNAVINDGSIDSAGTAVFFDSDPGSLSTSTVINRGLISGSFGIIGFEEKTIVTNYGTIEATVGVSVALSGNNDTVINRGFITGNGFLGAGHVSLGAGNDLYDGREGRIDSIVFGGDGDDKLYAGAGDNELHGDANNDTLVGGAGADVLNGGSGTDRASYSTASAGVTANLSKPSANKGDAKGDVYSSIEELRGSAFDDKLTGNSSKNALFGGDGDDTINGARGNDSLSGGEGEDQFIFDSTLNASTNVDTITDFDVTEDRIQIDNAVFSGLSAGTLASSAFKANTSGNASDASDRIVYETDTGNLYFDADGNGAGAKVLFAKLDTGLALTNADFVVI